MTSLNICGIQNEIAYRSQKKGFQLFGDTGSWELCKVDAGNNNKNN